MHELMCMYYLVQSLCACVCVTVPLYVAEKFNILCTRVYQLNTKLNIIQYMCFDASSFSNEIQFSMTFIRFYCTV